MMTKNKQTITRLQDLVYRLAWNESFGCHTRNGFEHMIWPTIAHKAKWLIYFDLDNIHALNEAFGGYGPVDAMVKQVLATVRASDYVAGQFKSGDEFLVCLTESDERPTLDPEGFVKRLTAEFAKHNLTATFAIVPVKSLDLLENVQPAVDQVYAAKKARGVSR
jgi:GGDEF domain-containing protein